MSPQSRRQPRTDLVKLVFDSGGSSIWVCSQPQTTFPLLLKWNNDLLINAHTAFSLLKYQNIDLATANRLLNAFVKDLPVTLTTCAVHLSSLLSMHGQPPSFLSDPLFSRQFIYCLEFHNSQGGAPLPTPEYKCKGSFPPPPRWETD